MYTQKYRNWMEYDCDDSCIFGFEPNGILFGSKLEKKIVTAIIFHQIWNEIETYFSKCIYHEFNTKGFYETFYFIYMNQSEFWLAKKSKNVKFHSHCVLLEKKISDLFQIWIVTTLFQMIWPQTEFCLVPNQSV